MISLNLQFSLRVSSCDLSSVSAFWFNFKSFVQNVITKCNIQFRKTWYYPLKTELSKLLQKLFSVWSKLTLRLFVNVSVIYYWCITRVLWLPGECVNVARMTLRCSYKNAGLVIRRICPHQATHCWLCRASLPAREGDDNLHWIHNVWSVLRRERESFSFCSPSTIVYWERESFSFQSPTFSNVTHMKTHGMDFQFFSREHHAHNVTHSVKQRTRNTQCLTHMFLLILLYNHDYTIAVVSSSEHDHLHSTFVVKVTWFSFFFCETEVSPQSS